MKSDAQLKKDVEAELDWEPKVNAARIGVEVKEGIVTLAGHLDSFPEKLAAENAAQRVNGVRGVAVEIDVKLPGASRRTDSDIAHAAVDALTWNTLVPSGSVKLTVEEGWITLEGDVEWEYQRSAAESAVRPLIGVMGIRNAVKVKPRPSQGNIKGKIEAALQRAAHVQADGISVAVEGGKVTLSGKVHSYTDRHLVEEAAWAAPGVASVVDRIQISP